jgi:hypothetical protein
VIGTKTVVVRGVEREKRIYNGLAGFFHVTPRTVKRWFGFGANVTESDRPYFQNHGIIPIVATGQRPIDLLAGSRIRETNGEAMEEDEPDYNPALLRRIWFASMAGYGGDSLAGDMNYAPPPNDPPMTRGIPQVPRPPSRGLRPEEWPTGFERDPIWSGDDMEPVVYGPFATPWEAVNVWETIYDGTHSRSPFEERAWYRAHIQEVRGGPNEFLWVLTVYSRGRAMGEGSEAYELTTDSDGTPMMEAAEGVF